MTSPFLRSFIRYSEGRKELSKELGITPPKFVGWYPAENINAFAMGTNPDNTLVAFTQPAIETLTKEELDAIMAHELAHIANNDMKRMAIAYGAQEALTFFLVFRGFKRIAKWAFSPLTELEILRLSRKREYEADKIGGQLTSPEDMAAALQRIKDEQQAMEDGEPLMISSNRTSGYGVLIHRLKSGLKP